MNFNDPSIESVDITDPLAIYQLIVRDLCGEIYYREFDDSSKDKIGRFLAITSLDGLNHAQFNELLLILDQDRVTEGFFNFFLLPDAKTKTVAMKDIPKRVVRFRGFAILCFGNFRFAYKSLSHKSENEISRALGTMAKSTKELTEQLRKRPKKTLRLQKIDRGSAWAVGYLAKKLFKKESSLLTSKINASPKDQSLIKLGEQYEKLGKELAETEKRALDNTDVYLTWDYMDVYVATSMRKRWEFDDVSGFVTKVFSNTRWKDLKVRYFDPTQSQCASRIDKGIVEALMLKRARCTVYMVQESDTMGKDSELASTLAQGKPVIAYVPHIDPRKHAKLLRDYPLDYFLFRFLTLTTDGTFEDDKFVQAAAKKYPEGPKFITAFFKAVAEYRRSQPFTLWDERENKFKAEVEHFDDICSILAIAEMVSADKRADVLREAHPLSLQVHLETGVLNGVLVVRSEEQTARLLAAMLTNKLNFTFHDDSENKCILLKEEISQSPFRVVTKNEKISNSFWNFYLAKEHYES